MSYACTKPIVGSTTGVVIDLAERKLIRVLHIDDEAGFLKVAKQCLEMQGRFQVVTALSVEEAMKKLEKNTYDVVVSDYIMPGKNGLELLKELREKGNNVPFIVFTGKGREEVAIRALNLGADQYINKSGHPETVYGELAYGITKAMKLRQAEKAMWENEKKHRTLLDEANVLIQSINAEGKFVYVNKEWKKMLGYADRDLEKITLMDVIRKDHHKYCMDVFKQVKKGESIHGVETVFVAKDGREIIVRGNARPILKDGEFVSTVGFFVDITERKKVEEKIIQRNRVDKLRAEIWEAAARISDERELIQELLNEVGPFFNIDNAAFMRIYPKKKKAICDIEWKKEGSKGGLGTEIPLWTLKRYFGKPYILVSKEHIPKFARPFIGPIFKRFGTTSSLLVPFGDIDNPEGYVTATVFKEEKNWAEDEIEVFREISKIVSLKADQVKARKTLEESEERCRRLVELAPDSIVTLDMKGVVTSCNTIGAKLLGYSKNQIIGKHFSKLGFLRACDVPKFLKMLYSVAREKVPKPFEVTCIRKDGTHYTGEIRVGLIKKNGKTRGFQVISRDVTERRKAEDALRESEEKFRLAFVNAKDAIFWANPKTSLIVNCNNAAESLLEKKREEIIGHHQITVHPPQEAEYYAEMFKRHIEEKGSIDDEAEVITRSGRIVPVHITASVTLIGGEPLIQGIFRDITERKQKEKEIQESQEKFEGLFTANPEAAAYVDSSFYIRNINPRFTELFGYSLDEIKGRTLLEVIVPEDKIEEAKMLDEKAIKGCMYHHDTVRKSKDGFSIPISLSAAPITVEGQLIGYVGVYKDISQLKHAEKELRVTLEKLQVVGSLSRHDVRNKLSTVKGNIYLAKRRLADDHEVLEHLSGIESALKQTERILDFAGIYEKLGMEELVYMDVEKTLREAVMLFSELQDTKVVNDCHGLAVLADSLLQQLFYNLIHNSLIHGEKVSRIRVYYEEARKDKLELIYEDDGVGIPSAEKEKIFEDGYGKGTGYGLHLIRKMCEVYSWTIRETGEEGEGAKTIITIPKLNESGKIGYSTAEPWMLKQESRVCARKL